MGRRLVAIAQAAASQMPEDRLMALQPGDTLTIGPGEYFESVRRDKLGNAEKETVIRAVIPPASPSPVSGTR